MNFIKKIVVWKLDLLAQMYLWRFKPDIVAVTGNVGKTSAKEAISVVLSKVKKVRSGRGNLNNEFGVPLTIISDSAGDSYGSGNSAWFWFKVLIVGLWSFIFRKNYPEVLVLEFGADKPGDIGRLVAKYKPKVGVITAVGDIPVHVEYFSDPDKVAKEKSKLISSMKSSEYAVLNHDDPAVYDMKDKTKAKVISYGFTEGASVRISNFDFRFDEDGNPGGIGFKINTWGPYLPAGKQAFVPVTIHGVLGKSQALAAGAAACVGGIYGMNLIEISQTLIDYHGINGRLKLLGGIKNSLIIDDTYNAAPASMHLALDTLKSLPAKRKIAVLGDMLELGRYTIEAHREVGNMAGSIVDILVTVGLRAKLIADSAENQLAPASVAGMPKGSIYSFPTSDSAKIKVQELMKEGDLVLVKGSQGIRMEKIVEEIMAEPEKKSELLVRQSRKWLKK